MKRFLILLAALLMACASAQAVEDCAFCRTVDKDFQVQIKREKPVDHKWFKKSVMIGDSITRSLYNYEVLPNMHILSLIGQSPNGAMKNRQYRVKGEPTSMADKALSYKPKKLMIMLGSNGLDHGRLEQVAKDYHTLVDYFLERLPDADMYLLSVLPIGPAATKSSPSLTMNKIRQFNDELLAIATAHGLHYIDLFTPLLSDDGSRLRSQFSAGDGLHLTQKGAQEVADQIRMQVAD